MSNNDKKGLAKATYTPQVYTEGEMPAAGPAVTSPLPAQRLREKELARKKVVAEKQQKYQQKIATQKSKGGFFGTLGAAAMTAVSSIENVADKTRDTTTNEYYSKSEETSIGRFRKLGYPVEEALLSDFHCSIVSGSFFATGYIFISTHYLTFDGTVKALYTASQQKESLTIAVPLSEIVSIQRGVPLRAVEQGRPPTIQVVSPTDTVADAILIYDKSGRVHQFFDFKHMMIQWFDDAWNVLDHAWRASSGMPTAPPQ